jgi:hypothetical protein
MPLKGDKYTKDLLKKYDSDMEVSDMAERMTKEEAKKRFDAIRERAVKLGVLDINFIRANTSADALDCYEYTLDIVEKINVLDQCYHPLPKGDIPKTVIPPKGGTGVRILKEK